MLNSKAAWAISDPCHGWLQGAACIGEHLLAAGWGRPRRCAHLRPRLAPGAVTPTSHIHAQYLIRRVGLPCMSCVSASLPCSVLLICELSIFTKRCIKAAAHPVRHAAILRPSMNSVLHRCNPPCSSTNGPQVLRSSTFEAVKFHSANQKVCESCPPGRQGRGVSGEGGSAGREGRGSVRGSRAPQRRLGRRPRHLPARAAGLPQSCHLHCRCPAHSA